MKFPSQVRLMLGRRSRFAGWDEKEPTDKRHIQSWPSGYQQTGFSPCGPRNTQRSAAATWTSLS